LRSGPRIETYPPPVAAAAPLTPAQTLELAALNVMLAAGDGVLRVARVAGNGVGRSLIFFRITAEVEAMVLGASQPGFAQVLRSTRSALLTDLIVVESHRGRGIGTLLVEDALELTRLAALPRLSLEVRRDNLAAGRIYRRLGFELIGDGEVAMCTRAVS
jgi:ribosomal protein S18 acetylase RimI-like enzyme